MKKKWLYALGFRVLAFKMIHLDIFNLQILFEKSNGWIIVSHNYIYTLLNRFLFKFLEKVMHLHFIISQPPLPLLPHILISLSIYITIDNAQPNVKVTEKGIYLISHRTLYFLLYICIYILIYRYINWWIYIYI